MSRPLRLEFAGALYHVTSRGNERKTIYHQEDDFDLFLKILSDVCEQFNWVIHAYCLMTNHYHFLVETPDANLSKGMRQLNGVFTQSINRKHHRVGHLFQGRYKAILVDKDAYLLELCRYIILNPVRARMVDSPSEWLWSSWHNMVGSKTSPPWLATDALLQLFSSNRKQAIGEYVQFVEEGRNATIWDNLQHQVFLGADDFVEKYQPLQNERFGDLEEIPLKQRRSSPLTLQQYQAQSTSRNEAIMLAYKSGGYTLKEIGEYFGLHYSRVSRVVAKGKT
ncbi:transposase [Psychromonas sp.]|uniref:REP-associated tyrosine transposase n=1 Tax=Psychromonas sp. TaxID=1884585 RepID=UPI00356974B1